MIEDRKGNYIVEEDIVLLKLISLLLENSPAGCQFSRTINGFPYKDIIVNIDLEIRNKEELKSQVEKT